MKKLKKALAALAASAMMFSMAGCSDTRYAMTYNGGEKVNAGVYIYNLYTEMSYELTMAYYTTGAATIDLDSDKDGKKLREYLVEEARKATKEYAAITYEFNKLGLELTDEELSTVNDSVKSVWEQSGELLEEEGVSKESVRQVYKAQTMRTRLFDYYYAADGVEGVSDDVMKQYVEDNYVRYKAVKIPKSAAEDATEKDNENKENESVRDELLAKAEGMTFDEFDAIIDEYNAYAQAKQEKETSAEEDAADDGTVGPVMGEETDTEVEAPEEEVPAEEGNESAAESESGLEEEAVLDEEEESVDVSELATADEDEAANSNEVMFNYGEMDEESKASENGKLVEFINGLDINKATAYDDDSFYYIVIKGDITENSADYAETNHDSLLQTMKGEEFQDKIDSWVDEIGISENSDAIKRYTAQAVYDKQSEYYNKHSNV